MAVRLPLYQDSDGLLQGNIILREMTSSQVSEWVNWFALEAYNQNPSVVLDVLSTNNGNLEDSSGSKPAILQDSRLQAGAHQTSTTSFVPEGSTAEPSTLTVTYNKIRQTDDNLSEGVDLNLKRFPVYLSENTVNYTDSAYTAGNLPFASIRAMNATDFYDTFIFPAINILTDGTDRPGTYRIHSNTSLTNHAIVNDSNGVSQPVFTDTRADTTAYTSGGIGVHQLDQPTTITAYYLLKTTSNSTPTQVPTKTPLYITHNPGDSAFHNHLREFTFQDNGQFDLEEIGKEYIRFAAVKKAGYRMRYTINGDSGSNKGTGMADTKLDGSGQYTTRFVHGDDYRSQEFPDGTPQTVQTYFLKLEKY